MSKGSIGKKEKSDALEEP